MLLLLALSWLPAPSVVDAHNEFVVGVVASLRGVLVVVVLVVVVVVALATRVCVVGR